MARDTSNKAGLWPLHNYVNQSNGLGIPREQFEVANFR